MKNKFLVSCRPGDEIPAVQTHCILPRDPGNRRAGDIKSQDQRGHEMTFKLPAGFDGLPGQLI